MSVNRSGRSREQGDVTLDQGAPTDGELIARVAHQGPLGRILATGLANVKSSRAVIKEAIEEVGRVVTHDLAVARLLSHRVMVMKGGRVIETGLTDQVLDDPREPYTQLLVSSILPA